MSWCFLPFSVLRSPLSRDGNEIQEIWKVTACWRCVRAEVSVRLVQCAVKFIKENEDCKMMLLSTVLHTFLFINF